MRIVVVCGSHPRHLYVVSQIMETGLVAGIVYMKREKMIDDIPDNLSGHVRELYEHHFQLRQEMEDEYFGNVSISEVANGTLMLEIERTELNDLKVEKFIEDVSADVLFSYGPDLFKDNVINCVKGFALNLHGGLSPWYKGSATMFWTFYFLEPNYVGTTLHYITKKIDSGNIVHQTVPSLEKGDCMHRVACKSVVAAAKDMKYVFENIDKNGQPKGVEQIKNGKLFVERDWKPEYLRLIYDMYEDRIVDLFLDNCIAKKTDPSLIRFL